MTPIESLLKLLLKPNASKFATPKLSFPQLAELALSGNDNKLAINIIDITMKMIHYYF